MDKEVAKVAGQFLLRVQLAGSEVPAFHAVMQALEDIINKKESECQTPKTP